MEAMSAMSLDAAQAILADPSVIAVGARGDDERRRRHGSQTTFVRVFEVHTDAVPSALPPGASAGELRIAGRPASVAAAIASVRQARAVAGDVPVSGFSLADLIELAGGSVASLTDLSARLASAGLHHISDAPLDRLDAPVDAIRAARDGGLSIVRLTVQQSDEASRLPLLLVARDVQAAVGGIRAFAPLPRESPVAQPSTGYDDVRLIAAARLVAHNIDSIQVQWPLYGPKLAQVALTMGADDVDGVSALEGDLGRRRSPLEEIRGNIAAAGLEAVERDGAWRILNR
jgi:aminodeoxyfutalosine synthase